MDFTTSINFCHIVPTPHLEELTKTNGSHLILAHLIDPTFNVGVMYNQAYTDYYRDLDDGKYVMMDNSAFEMVKHNGGVMYQPERLIEMGKRVNADCIVLSDYPAEPWEKTRDMAIKQIPQFKEAGFDTFYVPQSEIGDLEGYIQSIEWALDNEDIDVIGISILGVPNAFGGIEKDNKLQRFLARWRMMNLLQERGILDGRATKRLHFLGMLDGPREIELVKNFQWAIRSWDTSSAPWAGLNGVAYDETPTGLIDGKFEKEVDFDFAGGDVELAKQNIAFIDKMVK
ncbi:hypothetical protein VPHD479_0064 [Vibrio phage D479]